MLEKLITTNNNVLAIEIIDGFTKIDENIFQKFFQKQLDFGYDQINVLIKLDEIKISNSSIKAFMEDILSVFRHYKKMGHIAIVAHSKITKALVPIDNLFFKE